MTSITVLQMCCCYLYCCHLCTLVGYNWFNHQCSCTTVCFVLCACRVLFPVTFAGNILNLSDLGIHNKNKNKKITLNFIYFYINNTWLETGHEVILLGGIHNHISESLLGAVSEHIFSI